MTLAVSELWGSTRIFKERLFKRKEGRKEGKEGGRGGWRRKKGRKERREAGYFSRVVPHYLTAYI